MATTLGDVVVRDPTDRGEAETPWYTVIETDTGGRAIVSYAAATVSTYGAERGLGEAALLRWPEPSVGEPLTILVEEVRGDLTSRRAIDMGAVVAIRDVWLPGDPDMP